MITKHKNEMKKSTMIVFSILLAVSLILFAVEMTLQSEQNGHIRFLEETPSFDYPIWDVPEDESPEDHALRTQRIEAAAKKDGITVLLSFCLCPLGIVLCTVAGVMALRNFLKTPKARKKYLLFIAFAVSFALAIPHICVLIGQLKL